MLKIQVKSALKMYRSMSMLFPDLVFYSSKKCKSNFGEEQVKMVVKADHDVEHPYWVLQTPKQIKIDYVFVVLIHSLKILWRAIIISLR